MKKDDQARKRGLRILRDLWKKNKRLVLMFIVMTAVLLAVFLLYDALLEPFWYAELLGAAALLIIMLTDYLSMRKKAKMLEAAKVAVAYDRSLLPAPDTLEEQDYRDMIEDLTAKMNELIADHAAEKQEMEDYYTCWVHQIKTPIAVMRLTLDRQESSADLKQELFRIEQYADMALSYIRLEAESNDLVIRGYDLDDIIRETIRKYAQQFILKKLKLDYEPAKISVITDKKWLSLILEQLLSNAIKYTSEGTVSIRLQGSALTISDTGAGIAAEDLPRIFEKGYTGINGRGESHSSGLGLFMAKKAADKLSIRMDVESEVGGGSEFTLTFNPECLGSRGDTASGTEEA